jgi:hypothetical protein
MTLRSFKFPANAEPFCHITPKAIYPFLEAVGPLLSAGIERDNPEGP